MEPDCYEPNIPVDVMAEAAAMESEPDTRECEPYTETLECDLSDEEVSAFADELCGVLTEYDNTEDERKRIAKSFANKLTELHTEGVRLRRSIESRKETRPVNCERRIDIETGQVECVRLDTGEVVNTFVQGTAARQTDLEAFAANAPIEFTDADRERIERIDIPFSPKADCGAEVLILETPQGVYMGAGMVLAPIVELYGQITPACECHETRKDALGAAYNWMADQVRLIPETAKHEPTKRAQTAFEDLDRWLDSELQKIMDGDTTDPAAMEAESEADDAA